MILPTQCRIEFRIVGDLAKALQVSGVSVQVSALAFVILTPEYSYETSRGRNSEKIRG
jgi:hypothetical protein